MSLDSSTDLGALTRVVYGEARGESEEGKRGVAWTVINRHKKSCKTIQQEATKKSQFCCYSGEMKDIKARDECKKVAEDAINNNITDPTGGATFFYSDKNVPSWATGLTPCKTIGGHKFFKDIAPYK